MQRKPIFHIIPQVTSFGWKLKIKLLGLKENASGKIPDHRRRVAKDPCLHISLCAYANGGQQKLGEAIYVYRWGSLAK